MIVTTASHLGLRQCVRFLRFLSWQGNCAGRQNLKEDYRVSHFNKLEPSDALKKVTECAGRRACTAKQE